MTTILDVMTQILFLFNFCLELTVTIQGVQYSKVYSILLLLLTRYLLPMSFQVLVLISGIGVLPTLKLIFKYPIIGMTSLASIVYAPIHYDLNISFSTCHVQTSSNKNGNFCFSWAKSSELTVSHTLTIILSVVMAILQALLFFLLLYPGQGITDVYFSGLQLNSNQIIKIIAITIPASLSVRILVEIISSKFIEHKVLYIP